MTAGTAAGSDGAGATVPEVRGGLPVLTWPLLAHPGLDAVVTTREGGVSGGPYATLNLGLHVGDDQDAVVENRRRAAAALGLGLEALVFCTQAHGREVATVGAADRGRGALTSRAAIDGADALVTRDPDVGLVVMVADCAPIVLFDPVTATLACVHAGWRGTLARVVDAALAAMAAHGARPADVLAGIGPAIPQERYQVGPEVAAAARHHLEGIADAVLEPDVGDRWRLDLWAANRALLEHAGVPPSQIATTTEPTGGRFFSDRAQRPCGRFAALARLRPPA